MAAVTSLALAASILAPAPAANAAAARPKVVIDPDHGYAHLSSPEGEFNSFPINLATAQAIQAQLPSVCAADVVITQTTDGGPSAGSRAARAAQMTDADLSVTLSMNSHFGVPWGFDPNEGGASSYATNRPDNLTFGNELAQSISAATTRPFDLVNTAPTKPGVTYPYDEYKTLSGTYAQVFMLFIDNNFDFPVWHDNPQVMVNGLLAAIGHTLETKGFPCHGSFPALPTVAELQRLRNLGYQRYLRFAADPISMSTGNFTTSEEIFTLTGVGSQAIDLTLNYNAQSGQDSPVGIGWQFAYGAFLQQYNDGSIGVHLPDGRALLYEPDGDGFTTPAGAFAALTKLDDTTFRWTTTTQTSPTFTQDPETGRGALTGTQDRQGNTETLTYGSPGALFPTLETITDQADQHVVAGTDDDGRITSFTRPDGGVWELAYSSTGDLTSITSPRGTSRQFGYDSEHRMTSEVGQDGVTFLTNTYDGDSRVVSQTSAFGDVRTVAYDDTAKLTTYTDTTGAVTVYHWNDLGQVTSVVDALGGVTETSYNTELLPATETNPLGQATTRAYDASGQPDKVTDPLGNATTFSYNRTGDPTATADAGGSGGSPRTISHALNDDGLPTTTTNPDGTTVARSFNSFGDITSRTNETGDTTTFGYDARGNTTTVTDALGRDTSMAYDLANRLTGVTDPLSRTTTYSYDANDNLTQVTHPNDSTELRTYDVNDQPTTSTDRRGAVTAYARDAELNLVKVTLPNGGEIINTFDGENRLTSTTDPLGATTTFTLDALGRRTGVTDARGNPWTTAYDAAGRVTSETDPSEATTTFATDANGRVLTATDPIGGVMTNEWDAVGRVTSVTDELGHTTTHTYDFRDQVLTTTDPVGGVSTNEYDDAGRLIKQIDPSGAQTEFAYDDAGQLVKITDALGGQTTFAYDPAGNQVTVTDANGHETTTDYNNMNEPVASTDGAGNTWTLTRDAGGLVTAMTNPLGHVAARSYDTMGDLTAATDGLGRTTGYAYDLASQRITETAADDVVTANAYDPVGNLISVTQNRRSGETPSADTNVLTSYAYDSRNLLSTSTDPNGAVTTYGHDARGQRSTETNPMGNVDAFTYDLAGNLATRTDANGKLTNYTYDQRDLPTERAYPDGTSDRFSYDPSGRQLTATNGSGIVTTAYDLLDRPTSVVDANGKKLAYTYDAVGNRTGMKLPDGKTIAYRYDDADRLNRQTSELGEVNTTYDDAGRTVRVDRPNGTATASTYDEAGQLAGLTTTKGSKPIAGFTYTYDSVGNVTSRKQTGRTSHESVLNTYRYDPLRRLTESRGGLLPSNYTYDAGGNRLTWTSSLAGIWLFQTRHTNTYDAAGELTRSEKSGLFGPSHPYFTTTHSYDPNGNRTLSVGQAGQLPLTLTRTAYAYDFENRLLAAGPATRTGQLCDVQPGSRNWQCLLQTAPLDWLRNAQTRRYDALGRLSSETQGRPQRTTRWTADGLDPIIATEDKSTLFLRDGNGDLLGQKTDRQDADWYVTDRLESIVTSTNKKGDRSVAPISYSDYGVTLGVNPYRFGFTGEQTDPGPLPGLSQFYARAYEPSSGTWLQPDPIEGSLASPETQAPYQYVGGNPTSNTDLLGFLSVEPCCGGQTISGTSVATTQHNLSVGNANSAWNTSSLNGGNLQSGNGDTQFAQPTISAQQLQPTVNPFASRVPAAKGQISRLVGGSDLQGLRSWLGGTTVPWASSDSTSSSSSGWSPIQGSSPWLQGSGPTLSGNIAVAPGQGCRAYSDGLLASYLSAQEPAPCLFAELFYQPDFQDTDAGRRAADPGGVCSLPAVNSGPGFDFRNACLTHDYGYDLLRFRAMLGLAPRSSLKDQIDTRFGQDLRSHCRDRGLGAKGQCYFFANTYEVAVILGASYPSPEGLEFLR